MKIDIEILKIISDRSNNSWLNGITSESANIIRSKIKEVPSEFFEPRISIDGTKENRISLIEFSMQMANVSPERRNGLMDKYHIDPYDMNKLQGIVDSIKVARSYGTVREERNTYGIALATEESLNKAYPLWVAYLYADSKNPIEDIRVRLKEDKMEGKYEPEYIVSLMEHTNSLMAGKPENEKKDFYMQSISGILEENNSNFIKKNKEEVEI